MPIFRSLSIVMVVAILLNAIAPALAHAAKYLQDSEVNSNTLIRDAYVAVTYYDSNGEQKLAKGWINAIDETTFEIRSRALFGKTTIAYDKVVSMIMSAETDNRTQQMREVEQFIREEKKRKIEQAISERTENRPRRILGKLGVGLLGGLLGGSVGGAIGANINENICKNAELWCIDDEVALGLAGGYLIGVALSVSWADSNDRFIGALGGTLIGGATGIALTNTTEDLWPSILIGPIIGATIMSEFTRKPPESHRLSVSLAPNSDGKLSAIATLRF